MSDTEGVEKTRGTNQTEMSDFEGFEPNKLQKEPSETSSTSNEDASCSIEDDYVFSSFDEALEENVKFWHRLDGNIPHYSPTLAGHYTRNMITQKDKMPLDLLREINRHVITISGQPDFTEDDFPASKSFLKLLKREDLTDIPCHDQQRAYVTLICTPEQAEVIAASISRIGAYYMYAPNDHSSVDAKHNYPSFFEGSKDECWLTRTVFQNGSIIKYTNIYKNLEVFDVFDNTVVVMEVFGLKKTNIRCLLQAVLDALEGK